MIKALRPAADGGGGGFGFIRACERASDVFFHFSALSGMSSLAASASVWRRCMTPCLSSMHSVP